MVPMRERSLELFGDEKRLEALLGGQLLWEGRLTLRLLRCRRVHPPFVWRQVGAGPWALVAENHDTFYSLGRTLPADGHVGVLIYGSGVHFQTSVTFLSHLAEPPSRLLYFGDLDAGGLRVPAAASRVGGKGWPAGGRAGGGAVPAAAGARNARSVKQRCVRIELSRACQLAPIRAAQQGTRVACRRPATRTALSVNLT